MAETKRARLEQGSLALTLLPCPNAEYFGHFGLSSCFALGNFGPTCTITMISKLLEAETELRVYFGARVATRDVEREREKNGCSQGEWKVGRLRNPRMLCRAGCQLPPDTVAEIRSSSLLLLLHLAWLRPERSVSTTLLLLLLLPLTHTAAFLYRFTQSRTHHTPTISFTDGSRSAIRRSIRSCPTMPCCPSLIISIWI